MIAQEGYSTILVAGCIAVAIASGALFVPTPWRWGLFVLATVLVAFVFYFFRDPPRSVPADVPRDTLLLAPADGRVVLLQDVAYEALYLKGPARQVSIFLSPLDVHVNRSPADGVVEFDEYVEGDYLVAWHPKASEKNERSQLGIRHSTGIKILFKQIAGLVARRVVYHVGVGDTLAAGERFGIVKFGSRMDVLVPPEVEIDVSVGDRVRAGETVLGTIWRSDGAGALRGRAEESAAPGVMTGEAQ